MNHIPKGTRVLVVEDEYLVAALIEDILVSAGCVVTGPIPRLSEALAAANHDTYDAALLDINLGGELIDPVAEALSARNVPFVFVTADRSPVSSDKFAERPLVRKPFSRADLLAALSALVKPVCPPLGYEQGADGALRTLRDGAGEGLAFHPTPAGLRDRILPFDDELANPR